MPQRKGWKTTGWMLLSGAVLLGGAPVPPRFPSGAPRPSETGAVCCAARAPRLLDMRVPCPSQACHHWLPWLDTESQRNADFSPRRQTADSRRGLAGSLLERAIARLELQEVLHVLDRCGVVNDADLGTEVEQLVAGVAVEQPRAVQPCEAEP